MTMRPKPKMLNRLPRILRAPKQQRIRPRRCPQRQLVHSQTLPARLLDPRSRRSREVQRRYCQLRDFQQARVVRDGSDYDEGFLRPRHFREPAEGHGWAVDARHEEAAEDDAIEGGGGAACDLRGLVMGTVEWGGWGVGGEMRDVRARNR